MSDGIQLPDSVAGAPVEILAPPGPAAPVVLDSPHSGRVYPDDFGALATPDQLRRGEDRFVDGLFADGPDNGAFLIRACFARTYIDPNRSLSELDAELIEGLEPDATDGGANAKHGMGLIFRVIGGGIPIYDRRLDRQEVQHRIDRYWRPYHELLGTTLETAMRRHGAVWHLNCHSMLPVGDSLSPDPGEERPDISLGDLDGRSCDGSFTRLVAAALGEMGYSVAINHPYKGALILERYGRPADGCHSLQIEINRALYMNPEDLSPHEGFEQLRRNLGRLVRLICDHAREQAPRIDRG